MVLFSSVWQQDEGEWVKTWNTGSSIQTYNRSYVVLPTYCREPISADQQVQSPGWSPFQCLRFMILWSCLHPATFLMQNYLHNIILHWNRLTYRGRRFMIHKNQAVQLIEGVRFSKPYLWLTLSREKTQSCQWLQQQIPKYQS